MWYCMIKSLDVTPEKPFFLNEGSNIFVFYDPPHLIKNVRNNFKKHGYLWNGTEILWRHVQSFFEFDNKNPVKMAPKLTHKHIYLTAFTAMRVKYATQVLSHTMASGISTLSLCLASCHLLLRKLLNSLTNLINCSMHSTVFLFPVHSNTGMP